MALADALLIAILGQNVVKFVEICGRAKCAGIEYCSGGCRTLFATERGQSVVIDNGGSVIAQSKIHFLQVDLWACAEEGSLSTAGRGRGEMLRPYCPSSRYDEASMKCCLRISLPARRSSGRISPPLPRSFQQRNQKPSASESFGHCSNPAEDVMAGDLLRTPSHPRILIWHKQLSARAP